MFRKTTLLYTSVILALATPTQPSFASAADRPTDRTRLIILADMGNEPDEEQQMAHMLMCSNEFDPEGLIAVTGKFLKPPKKPLQPELFHQLIDAFEQVYPNLRLHADGWHTPDYLRSIVASGQAFYGIEDVRDGRSSPGSELIKASLLRDDPRPIWVVVNAGANTLAQALFELRESESANTLRSLVAKLRVFENGAQDNAGAWIASEFPLVHWIRSNYQTYAYGGPGGRDGDVSRNLGPHYWHPFDYSVDGQRDWLQENVQTGHGALGEAYPDRRFKNGGLGFMEGGGTIPWLGLANKGLFDIDHPSWGGWSGRFTERKIADFWSRHKDIQLDEEKVTPFYVYREASDTWTDPQDGTVHEGDYVPVWRWREGMYADLQARMDWCVRSFEDANHHPAAAVDGDASDNILHIHAMAGETLIFDASASTDPDGDELEFSWWIYQEAGTYAGTVPVHGAHAAKATLTTPSGGGGKQIHLILEVRDQNPIVSLHDYRRIVIDVEDIPVKTEPQQR